MIPLKIRISLVFYGLFIGFVSLFAIAHGELLYRYEGQIMTGIPSLKSQVSGVGLRCQVRVQPTKNDSLVVKLTKIQVGKYNGNVAPGLRSKMNISYHDLLVHRSSLETPFIVFLRDEYRVMSVPKNEIMWITNIKKSIAQYFLIDPLRSKYFPPETLQGHIQENPNSYSVNETTVFGTCESSYKLLPVWEASTTEDLTVEKGWKVNRWINFDKCPDKVVLQESSFWSFPDVGKAFETSLQSRSSVGEFILKEESGNMILKTAAINGEIISNLYGIESNRFLTRTFQTLRLDETGASQGDMSPSSASDSFQDVPFLWQEVSSPFPIGNKASEPWIRYEGKSDLSIPFSLETLSLGKTISAEDTDEFTSRILHHIKDVVKSLESAPLMPRPEIKYETMKENLVQKLQTASDLIKLLPERNVVRIFSLFFPHRGQHPREKLTVQQNLLIDTACASGSTAAITEVFKLIKQNRLPDEKIATVFMTLTNHISSPFVMKTIIDHLMRSKVKQSPFVTAVSLINFANTLRKLCLQRHTILEPIFGRFTCNKKTMDKFITYIYQRVILYQKPWVKAIWLEAAIRIGPPYSTPLLLRALKGDLPFDTVLRITMIRGLLRHYERLSGEDKEEFSTLLNSIIDNPEEDIRLRHSAVIAVIASQPDSRWWQDLATRTHEEKSPEMAAFISFLIAEVAKIANPRFEGQAMMANFVLPFCKQFSANSKYPTGYYEDFLFPQDELRVKEGLWWLPGPVRELVFFLSSNLNGKTESLLEFSFDESHRGFFPLNRDQTKGHQRKRKSYGTIILSLWKSIEEFLPINYQTIQNSIGIGGNKLFRKIHEEGKEFHMVNFFRASYRNVFLPSELGLPVLIKTSTPAMVSNAGALKISLPDMSDITIQKLWKSLEVEIPFKSDFRMMYKLDAEVDILVPWSEDMVSAGIDNIKGLHLPLEGYLRQNIDQDNIHNFSISLGPIFRKRIPLFYCHNIPYTSLRYLTPQVDPLEKENFKLISIMDDQKPLNEVTFQTNGSVGVFADLVWKADEGFKLSRGFMMEYLKHPERILSLLMSPFEKLMQFYVYFDVPKSHNNNFTFATNFGEIDSCSESETIAAKSSSKRKRKQHKSYFKYFFHLNYLPTISEPEPEVAMSTRSWSFEAYSMGKEFYHSFLEMEFATAEQRKTAVSESAVGVAYKWLAIDRFGAKESKIKCFVFAVESPKVESLNELKNFLVNRTDRHLHFHYISAVRDCISVPPAYMFQGFMGVSLERKTRLLHELQETCDVDPFDPTVNFATKAVYDYGILDSYNLQTTQHATEVERWLFSLFEDFFTLYFEPQIFNSYVQDVQFPGESLISFDRKLESGAWNVKMIFPHQNTSLHGLKLPRFVDQIVSAGGFGLPVRQCFPSELDTGTNETSLNVLDNSDRSKNGQCEIEVKKYTNFDNRKNRLAITNCYTKAVTPLQLKKNAIEWSVMVRRINLTGNEIEVRLNNGNTNVVDVNSKEVKINGHKAIFIQDFIDILDKSGKFFCQITKAQKGFQVSLFNNIQVRIAETKITIELSTKFKNKIGGICGQFNNASRYLGPKKCLYYNNTLMAYSWTIPTGHWCDIDDYFAHELEVSYYQHQCPKKQELKILLN